MDSDIINVTNKSSIKKADKNIGNAKINFSKEGLNFNNSDGSTISNLGGKIGYTNNNQNRDFRIYIILKI